MNLFGYRERKPGLAKRVRAASADLYTLNHCSINRLALVPLSAVALQPWILKGILC